MSNSTPLGITELVLRDAHQSLLATRMRIDDMLPIAEQTRPGRFLVTLRPGAGRRLMPVFATWARIPGNVFVASRRPCRIRRMQMLFRGQNILGYRHYADDLVEKFVERCAANGVDVFRIFDALNDLRNLETAIKATLDVGKHAQGAMSYTVSPVHTIDLWVDMGRRIEDMGAHSICIKDMAGLLRPYVAFELVSRSRRPWIYRSTCSAMQPPVCRRQPTSRRRKPASTISTPAISSMSMTYGHSPTETLVAMLEGTGRDTGLDIALLEEIATYFREVRKKYAKFEGALKGVDSRILVAQVPGGMLTNLENQLREQNASDKLDEVLRKFRKVRKDLGMLPLVTPTSQIVGTQAVINVMSGARYSNISGETAGVLKGEYGATPAAVNAELQAQGA